MRFGLSISILTAFVLLSSGCVADNLDEDSVPGKVLDVFGDFSSENGDVSFEFSVDSLTDSSLMAPMRGAVDDFENNLSEEEGVELKSTKVRIKDISSDRAEFQIIYRADIEGNGTVERNFTMTLVKQGGSWTVEDPFAENIDGSYYDSSSYR